MRPVPGGNTSRGGRLPRRVRPSYTHPAEAAVKCTRPAEQEAWASYTHSTEGMAVPRMSSRLERGRAMHVLELRASCRLGARLSTHMPCRAGGIPQPHLSCRVLQSPAEGVGEYACPAK